MVASRLWFAVVELQFRNQQNPYKSSVYSKAVICHFRTAQSFSVECASVQRLNTFCIQLKLKAEKLIGVLTGENE